MKIRVYEWSVVIFVLVAFGCSDSVAPSSVEEHNSTDSAGEFDLGTDLSGDEPALSSLWFSDAPYQTYVGREIEVSLMGRSQDGDTVEVDPTQGEWTIEPSGIVDISGGTIRGVSEGEAKVTATFGGQSANARIHVGSARIAGVEFYVSEPLLVSPLADVEVGAVAIDEVGERRPEVPVSFRVDPQTRGRFEGPTLTARSIGSGVVIAEARGFEQSRQLHVVRPARIEIRPSEPRIHVGESVGLHVRVLDDEGRRLHHSAPVEWELLTSEIATLSDDGVLQSTERGRAWVTARSLGRQDTAWVDMDLAFDDLACHSGNCCARARHDGGIYCWGKTDPSGTASSHPRYPARADVGALEHFGVGRLFGCGLDPDGRAWCWGRNTHGTLGDGTTESRFDAQPVATDLRFESIHTALEAVCGVTVDRELHCWGSHPPALFSGDPDTVRTSPHLIDTGPVEDVRAAAGICFRREGHLTWYCFGENRDGDLGVGHRNPVLEPSPMAGSTPLAELSMGARFGCGLDAANSIWCWGLNKEAVLGHPVDPTNMWTLTPQRPQWSASVSHLLSFPAGNNACGLWGNDLRCWGQNHGCVLGKSNQALLESHEPVTIREWPKDTEHFVGTGSLGFLLRSTGDIERIGINIPDWWTPYTLDSLPGCDPEWKLFETFKRTTSP